MPISIPVYIASGHRDRNFCDDTRGMSLLPRLFDRRIFRLPSRDDNGPRGFASGRKMAPRYGPFFFL